MGPVHRLHSRSDLSRRSLLGTALSLGVPGMAGAQRLLYENEVPLFSLLTTGDAGSGPRITTKAQWTAKRKAIREKWIRDLLGTFPSKPAFEVREKESVTHSDHTVKKIEYASESDDRVTAYLLLPRPLQERMPAVLALQPTHGFGASDVAGGGTDDQRKYGLDLVRRGFVVLAPDVITSGPRIFPGRGALDTGPFYEKHPQWSILGKMLWDHMRGIDVLESLSYVNRDRIGALGWSLGGHNAVFLGAFDERIACVVSNGGMAMFAGNPNPLRWTREGQSGTDVQRFVYLPRLRPYLESGEVPFDLHEIQAILAPRPYLDVNCAPGDLWKGNVVAARRVREVYQLYRQPEHFRHRVFDGKHSFQPAMKEQAYGWLEQWLK